MSLRRLSALLSKIASANYYYEMNCDIIVKLSDRARLYIM